MLQNIRDKTGGWIATIILGIVIIPLAFLGLGDYIVPKVDDFAAKIETPPTLLWFGKKAEVVSTQEFRTRFDQVRAQQREAEGEAFDAAAFEGKDNKRLVLDRLVDEKVLEMAAGRAGVVVSAEQVRKEIAAIELFRVDGKFDKERYVSMLGAQGYTPDSFEREVRSTLVRRSLLGQLVESGLFGKEELEQFLRLSGQTRHVRFLEVPAPTDPVPPPSEAEIKAWYDAHAADYRTEETVAIEYLELQGSDLPVTAVPDEATLRAKYQSEITRFGSAEQRLVSHILVAVPAEADAAAWTAAQTKAKGIAERARAAGADFAKLAAELSDDLVTKVDGGDLGDVGEVGNDEFVAAVAKLQPGQITDPVRSPSGWHVLQYRELVPGSAKPFEEVRAQLEAEVVESEREHAFNDASSKLYDAINASPASLKAVAAKSGLKIQRTAAFTAGNGPGVAALSEVRAAAFEDEQKLERQVSDPIDLATDHVVVLQVVDHTPAATQPLTAVRDRVVNDITSDRLAKAAQARAEALLARVKGGESIDAIATELGGTVNEQPAMRRDPPGPAFKELFDAVFGTPRPAEGKPEAVIARMPTGGYALATVVSVTEGDLAQLDDATREMLHTQGAAARGDLEARAYVQALRKQFEITIREDNL
jgi:peptidyl-prolyl cis-trans isomerase D